MPGIVCLLVIWLIVALAVRVVMSRKPSEATTLDLLATKPGAGENVDARHGWIALFATQISCLDLDTRHRVLMNPRIRSAFVEMSPEDQLHLLASIETRVINEFIEGSKRWSLGRYERLMQPALADLEGLKFGSSESMEALLARPTVGDVGKFGIMAFLKETDPLMRFDTLPLIERIQKHSQMGR